MAVAESPVVIIGAAHVVDGDTLRIGAATIRLFGVDAPELAQRCTVKAVRVDCGARSAAWLRQRLVRVSLRCVSYESDRYGRRVAVCSDGVRDINAELVEAGWAIAFRTYSNHYVR